MIITERELTALVSLTNAAGLLNPDAVGWSRHPLHDTSGIDGRRVWGRNKRWEYWNIIGPRFIIGLTVSSIDYLGSEEVWVFDRETERTWHRTALVPFGRGVQLAPSLGGGTASITAGRLSITIDDVAGGGWHLRATIPGVELDVRVEKPVGSESLAVVVPWSEKRFQYTVKDVALPATGTLVIDGETHDLADGGPAWAVLDHGRGRWPYDVKWNWAAGSGVVDGRRIGIQLGAQWTDGTGSTENCLFVDGRASKISEELEWRYDTGNYLAPWRIRGELADLEFTPFYDKASSTQLGILAARTDQLFGHWAGWVTDESGEKVSVDGVIGFAEDVHNRW
jgi:hypothetical protein